MGEIRNQLESLRTTRQYISSSICGPWNLEAVSYEKHKACSITIETNDSFVESFIKFTSFEHLGNGSDFIKSPLGENNLCKNGTSYLVL